MLDQHISAVKEFAQKAGQPTPDKLTIPSENIRLLRAKLIMEEALEMCEGLGIDVSAKSMIGENIVSVKDLDFSISTHNQFDPVKVMDASVDILWVGVTGPAVMMGLSDKLKDCIFEVDSSNLSKFIDGHKDPESGKWNKGPSYRPANLEIIINGSKSK